MAGSNLLGSLGAQLRNAVTQRVIAVVALLIVAGGIVLVRSFGSHEPSSAQPVAAGTARTGTPAHPTAPAPHVAAAATQSEQAPTVVPARTSSVSARPVTGVGNGAPMVTSVAQGSVSAPNAAHLDDHLTYQYNALGRRDPFQSLVDGTFVGADVGGDAPPDPGGIKVVGIVWGATDQFALVEDVRGNSFVLRRGDKVQNGYVEGLKRDGVIVNVTAEGQSQSVVIPLVRKGDQNAR